MTSPALQDAITRLPERYQPIYGIDDPTAARGGDLPRTARILETISLISSTVERPLRVLDLGSAQSYYSFIIAEQGHQVVGVESLPVNVEVARAIGALHPELDVSVVEVDVVDFTADLAGSDFDVVLGLSILHHIAHRDGHDAARALVQKLSDCIPFALFEMALREEPVYWADALPSDPRHTLASYRVIRELVWSTTHLSQVERPLLYCSTTHALVGGRLAKITRYSETSHSGATSINAGRRRYVEFDGGIVKFAAHFGDVGDPEVLDQMRRELRSEAHALEEFAKNGLDVPSVLEFYESDTETVLARTTYPGELVSELIPIGDDSHRASIFEQVLEQLVAYESLGRYHNDLRTWNVVWSADEQRAHVIDYGAIQRDPSDLAWPNSAYVSFLLFAESLWMGVPEQLGLESPRVLRHLPSQLPPRAGFVIERALARSAGAGFFAAALEDWFAADGSATSASSTPTLATRALVDLGILTHADYAGQKAALVAESRANRQHKAERDALINERRALWQERELLTAERDALYEERDVLYQERNSLYREREQLLEDRERLYADREDLYAQREALYEERRRLYGEQADS